MALVGAGMSELGKALCEAVGIDPSCVHQIMVTLASGDVARLDIMGYVTKDMDQEFSLHYRGVKWEPVEGEDGDGGEVVPDGA